jgi:IS605 OrfB family transposase
VKLIARIKLQPTPAQHTALKQTLETANAACTYVSDAAWQGQVFGQFALHKLCYAEIRAQFGLGADVAVRVFAKVADAYKLDQRTQRTFRPLAAFPFNDRLVSYKLDRRIVSIWTMAGRQKIPFIVSEHAAELLKGLRGECDLLYRKGEFYLYQCCDVDESPAIDPDDFLGVDLGIANIAADSDARFYQGKAVKAVRHRCRRLRQKLQAKQTRSAKRLLNRLAGKERRFATDVNHQISKRIVQIAKDTGRGIALEELTGIRRRATARRSQRTILHSWAFAQLRAFIEYKAKGSGVPVVAVDPRNTSRSCPSCGCIDKRNRPSQDTFSCTSCGYSGRADYIAALNIQRRASLSRPNVAVSH